MSIEAAFFSAWWGRCLAAHDDLYIKTSDGDCFWGEIGVAF